MFDHFRVIPFLLGIFIGGIVLYFYKPTREVVKDYPHPKDAKDKIFKDPSGTCYTYTSHEVSCSANESTLKDYPIQG